MPANKVPARPKQPAFLEIAESFYGDAFGPRSPKELARSIADWSEMSPDEQGFAAAHLAWLDLQAQAGTQRLLVQIRALLEEIADGLELVGGAATEDGGGEFPEPPGVADRPAPEGRGEAVVDPVPAAGDDGGAE